MNNEPSTTPGSDTAPTRRVAETKRKTDKLTILEEISRRLRDSRRDPLDPRVQRSIISRRGKVHAELGLADVALQDCVEALVGKTASSIDELLALVDSALGEEPQNAATLFSGRLLEEPEVPRYALLGRLGEALRVYVRDVLFSQPPEAKPPMEEVISRSVQAFTRAEAELLKADVQRRSDDDLQLAWIRAHRGAAYSLHYWMLLTNGSPDAAEIFVAAENDFKASTQRGGKIYVWSIRFHALLVTLRAADGDFERARGLLDSVMGLDPFAQSSLHRSMSMLFSYETAAKNLAIDVRTEAARAGVAFGGDAVEEDPEDHIAAYFTAANWWWLAMHEPDPDLRKTHIEAHRAAIASARMRSRNAISQALTGLVGLRLMEALPPADAPGADDSAQNALTIDASKLKDLQELMGFLERFPPDFETRLIFARDPVAATIKLQMPEASKQIQSLDRNYDTLARKYQAYVKQVKQ